MSHDGFMPVGSFAGPHGYNGKINVGIKLPKNAQFTFPEPVYVYIQHTLVPFFIESVVPKGQKYIVKLRDIDSEAQAQAFRNKEIFIDEKLYNTLMEDCNPLLKLIGFGVTDVLHGEIGVLDEVLEYPGQDILKVIGPSNEEILIPANEHFITATDKKNRVITVSTPEGLLDLYLKK